MISQPDAHEDDCLDQNLLLSKNILYNIGCEDKCWILCKQWDLVCTKHIVVVNWKSAIENVTSPSPKPFCVKFIVVCLASGHHFCKLLLASLSCQKMIQRYQMTIMLKLMIHLDTKQLSHSWRLQTRKSTIHWMVYNLVFTLASSLSTEVWWLSAIFVQLHIEL